VVISGLAMTRVYCILIETMLLGLSSTYKLYINIANEFSFSVEISDIFIRQDLSLSLNHCENVTSVLYSSAGKL
jgi:hypothetical protein